ncbi:acid protease, partial [Fistulina hepatica ATCC 64428]
TAMVLWLLSAVTSAVLLHLEGQPQTSSQHVHSTLVGISPLSDAGDISYYTNITLGDQLFRVLIDTGRRGSTCRSDLWVAGDVTESEFTGFDSGVTYAVGEIEAGPIKSARLAFADYVLPHQAFIEVEPDEDNRKGEGLLGLGPNSGSNVWLEMNSSAGYAVSDNIFLQNSSTPKFITVLLGRADDTSDPFTFQGDMTIGSLLDNYTEILTQPKLAVTAVPEYDTWNQHFQIHLDDDGIVGPDGEVISMKSSVQSEKDKKKLTAVIDTGFSLSQISTSAASAIYSRFSGAEMVNIQGLGQVWIVPCAQEVNITFKFAGQSFPVHPLDTTLDARLIGIDALQNSEGTPCCIGLFQPISFDVGTHPQFDMVLGMSFLRNVYTLIYYGDFVAGGASKDQPYIQFLSTTDHAKAHSEFVRTRLGGID